MSKCNWCGGEICEGEEVGSSQGTIHMDCAPEVSQDDMGQSQEQDDWNDDYFREY